MKHRRAPEWDDMLSNNLEGLNIKKLAIMKLQTLIIIN